MDGVTDAPTATAGAPPTGGRSDVHAWDRFVVGWHVAFWLFMGLTAIWILATADLSTRGRQAAFVLIGVLGVAYILLILRRDPREGWAGVAYLTIAVTVVGLACALSTTMTMLLFVVFSQVWMFSPSLRVGALFAVLLSASATVGVMMDVGWEPRVAREIIPSLGVALGFSLLLGFWVARIIEQSRERADLIVELEAAREELARAENARGVLAERERMAREIHDTLAQGFTSVVMLAQAAAARLPQDPDGAAQRLTTIEDVARSNLAEARALVAALAPVDLDGTTLADAVRRVAARFAEQTGVTVDVDVPDAVRNLSRDQEVVVLRAAQEALANVRRHAGARHVVVRLAPDDGLVQLEVGDDGVGFDPQEREGFGLAGMRGRVGEVGGDVAVASAPGGGTRVVVRVPASATAPEGGPA
jgi:signal transduction histidine kinase